MAADWAEISIGCKDCKEYREHHRHGVRYIVSKFVWEKHPTYTVHKKQYEEAQGCQYEAEQHGKICQGRWRPG